MNLFRPRTTKGQFVTIILLFLIAIVVILLMVGRDSFTAPNEVLFLNITLAIACGAVAAVIVKHKGYNPLGASLPIGIAAIVGFWVISIVGIAIVAVIPHKKIVCPKCGQRIVHTSKYCPFCKHSFSVYNSSTEPG